MLVLGEEVEDRRTETDAKKESKELWLSFKTASLFLLFNW